MSNKEFTTYHNKLTTIILQSKISHYSEAFANNSKNIKIAWKLINELAGNDIKNIDFPKNLNCNSNNNNFFAELVAKAIQNLPTSPYFNYKVSFPSVPQTFVFDDISSDEIEKVALLLPLSSSCGHDNLSGKLVKNIIKYISLPLSKLFNKSVFAGVVPLDLKIAKVAPIFKSGDINQLITIDQFHYSLRLLNYLTNLFITN